MRSILIFAITVLLCSCSKLDHDKIQRPESDGLIVAVTVRPSEQDIFTRSLDETAIKDINIFFYSRNSNVIFHGYGTQNSLQIEAVAGEYMMYVIANYGSRMNRMDEESLLNLKYNATDLETLSVVPMTYCQEVTLSGNDSKAVHLPIVYVERNVAKIDYNIHVRAAEDIRLISLQFCNLPESRHLFGESAIGNDGYSDGPVITAAANARAINGTLYMLENMAGENHAITHQRDKSYENAPADATYAHIRAVMNDQPLDYFVFLGENPT